MPSGAKRRKAAKKKKQNIGNIAENQQGNGDSSKSHDDKDSDSSSVSSPTTSHEHRNPLRKEEDSDDEKSENGRDVSAAGSASDEPHDVSIEKSQIGSKGTFVEELEVTKEVDSESRVVNIEDVKEPNVKVVKGEETCFGDSIGGSSNGGIQVVEKKIEVDPPKIDELNESKEGEKKEHLVVESVSVIEPIEEAVSPTKEVTQIVSQPEGAIQPAEFNLIEKIADSSITEGQSDDRVLPQSNGSSVDTGNGSGSPIGSHTSNKSDNQKKDMAPVPPTVRPTSWKSCCGLFDLFVGSNR